MPAVAQRIMRKEILPEKNDPTAATDDAWLDVVQLARIRLTSEDPAHPIEDALTEGGNDGSGWVAAEPGRQTIWLHFDSPQAIDEISLRFERAESCTQEFVLSWSADQGRSYQELVRQQYNFSPGGSQVEEESFYPALSHVTDLELRIVPDISDGDSRASVRRFLLRGR
jgi:hypothetical protein